MMSFRLWLQKVHSTQTSVGSLIYKSNTFHVYAVNLLCIKGLTWSIGVTLIGVLSSGFSNAHFGEGTSCRCWPYGYSFFYAIVAWYGLYIVLRRHTGWAKWCRKIYRWGYLPYPKFFQPTYSSGGTHLGLFSRLHTIHDSSFFNDSCSSIISSN